MLRRSFVSALGGSAITLHADARSLLSRALATAGAKSPDELADDEEFWFQVRQAYTVDRNNINLNNGSVAPSPKTVQQAQHNYLAMTNMSPSFYVDEMLYPGFEVVRRRLAQRFGCESDEIALTRNTTEALEIVQLGMPLERGDEVVTTTQDYPSMITAWRQREKRDGIVLKMVRVPTPPGSPDDLFNAVTSGVTPKTKVIHISHITFTAGQILPVRRISRFARERGIEVVVDGGHSFAQWPFTRDDMDVDYYGTSLHKWLSAPVGTGFLYVRKAKIPKIWPLFAHPDPQGADIRKFEQIGTFPVHVRNPITEALDFYESIGPEHKAARLRFLRRRWMNALRDVPKVRMLTPDADEMSCAIGTMRIDGIGAQALTDSLMAKHRIHVRPRFVPDEWEGIRVTPNVYTTLEEVDTFARAIRDIATRGI